MVADGFAFAYLKYKFSKSDLYENAQIRAREMNLGIWGNSQNESSKQSSLMKPKDFGKLFHQKPISSFRY